MYRMLKIILASSISCFSVATFSADTTPTATALTAETEDRKACPGVTPENQAFQGVLTCAVLPTVGAILFSNSDVFCEFEHPQAEQPLKLEGEITVVGPALGITDSALARWNVMSAGQRVTPSEIASTYTGFSVTAGNTMAVEFCHRNGRIKLRPTQYDAGSKGAALSGGATAMTLKPREGVR